MAVAVSVTAQNYVISTFAGGSPPQTPALGVEMVIGYPYSVAADAEGNGYFASFHSVFKVDPSGTVSRIAGNGRQGYSGDGGLATAAQLSNPRALTVDSAGNVYVGDAGNYRIRKISTEGTITTIAGNGAHGYSGDGGPAIEARLSDVSGLAVDRTGDVFLAENYYFENNMLAGGNRVRRITPDGVITTVAGNGSYSSSGDGGPAVDASFRLPYSIAVDGDGNLFIADYFGNRVRRVSPDGIITTVVANGTSSLECVANSSGDGGPASSAHFCAPRSVAVDAEGNLFIGEFGFQDDHTDDRTTLNFLVRKISRNGVITTVGGNGVQGFSGDGGQALRAQLEGGDVAVDGAGELLLADGKRIRRIASDGIIRTIAGNGERYFSGDGGPAIKAMLNEPYGLAADDAGNVYVMDDPFYTRIRKISRDGIIKTVAGNGTQGYSDDGGPATSAAFVQPQGIAVDSADDLFIADLYSNRLRKVSPDGTLSTVAGNGGASWANWPGAATAVSPSAVAVDREGTVLFVDGFRIRKVDRDGVISTVAGLGGSPGDSGDGGLAIQAQLQHPTGIAVDYQGNVLIADGVKIRKVSRDGVITTVAGNGVAGYSGDGGPATAASLEALSVAVDSSGNVFILGGLRVRKIAPDGIITTIAGTGTWGYSGDDGPATSAQITGARGIAVDGDGNVYIADRFNNAIRVLRPVSTAR